MMSWRAIVSCCTPASAFRSIGSWFRKFYSLVVCSAAAAVARLEDFMYVVPSSHADAEGLFGCLD